MGLPARIHSQATHQAGEHAESTAALQVPLAWLAVRLLTYRPACLLFDLLTGCFCVHKSPSASAWRWVPVGLKVLHVVPVLHSWALCCTLCCRGVCLAKFLACWVHALDIATAFNELADTHWANILTRRSQVSTLCLWQGKARGQSREPKAGTKPAPRPATDVTQISPKKQLKQTFCVANHVWTLHEQNQTCGVLTQAVSWASRALQSVATIMHVACVALQAMLAWWRQWVLQKQQQQELLESSCCHMETYMMLKCVNPVLAELQHAVHSLQAACCRIILPHL